MKLLESEVYNDLLAEVSDSNSASSYGIVVAAKDEQGDVLMTIEDYEGKYGAAEE